jgi:hypothetical protein
MKASKMGEAETVLHRGAKHVNMKAVSLQGILAKSNGENSLSTPDFRFVQYFYQKPTWAGPFLPQTHQPSDAPFAPGLLEALRHIR